MSLLWKHEDPRSAYEKMDRKSLIEQATTWYTSFHRVFEQAHAGREQATERIKHLERRVKNLRRETRRLSKFEDTVRTTMKHYKGGK